jgi:hypothetical protein
MEKKRKDKPKAGLDSDRKSQTHKQTDRQTEKTGR